MHTDFACLLYHNHIVNKLPAELVYEIVGDAVAVEKDYVCEALPVRLVGMSDEKMSQYIEFVADRLLQQLGYDRLYNASNPFPFMEMISLNGKTNFFERRVSEYSKSGVMSN